MAPRGIPSTSMITTSPAEPTKCAPLQLLGHRRSRWRHALLKLTERLHSCKGRRARQKAAAEIVPKDHLQAYVRLRLRHPCTVTSVLMNARACATATRLVSSAFHPFQDPPATEPSQDASLSGNPTARRMNPWQGARRQPFLLPLCKSRRPKLQCTRQNLSSHARHALHRPAGGVGSTQALRFGHAWACKDAARHSKHASTRSHSM